MRSIDCTVLVRLLRTAWEKQHYFNGIVFGTAVAYARNVLTKGEGMETLKSSSDTLFILLGAIMVLAMHSGFAFLELGTVRAKNQVNALVKILCDFSLSTVAYFFVGYTVAYGVGFLVGADKLADK